jgi:translocation and assembly module TamB
LTTTRAPRVKRVLRWALAAFGTPLVLAAALVASVLLHADRATSRRLVTTEVSHLLGIVLGGRVQLERIGGIGLIGLDGVRARVFEPGGRQVLYVDGLRVRLSLFDLLESLFADTEDLTIALDSVEIAYADVELDGDAEGELLLARAFTPRSDGAPGPATSDGRGVVFSARVITVAHAWAHGSPPGAILVDADVDHFRGSVEVLGDAVTVRVEGLELQARALPRGANPRGHASGTLVVPLSEEALSGDLQFAGDVRGIALQLRASMLRGTLAADVQLPHVAAADVRTLLPEAPIYADGSADITIHGTLPELGAEVHATLGGAAVDASIRARFDEPLQGSLEARATDVDLRTFAPGAPGSRLGADVRADARVGPTGLVEGAFDLSILRGELDGNALPAARVRGRLDGGTLSGQVSIDEPGLPIHGTFALSMQPEPRALSFTLDAKAPELSRVRRFDAGLRGEARVHVAGSLDLVARTVDARAEGGVAHVRANAASAARGFVWADLRGSLTDPNVIARVELTDVDAAGTKLEHVRAAIDGNVHSARITASLRGAEVPQVDLATRIETTPALAFFGTTLTLAREGITARATIGAARFGPTLRIEDGHLTGLGEPTAFAFEIGPEQLALRAQTSGLDLARLVTLAGAGARFSAGTLALDADVTLSARDARGHVKADLTGGTIAGKAGLALHVDTHMQGERLAGQVRATLGPLGHALFETTDLRVSGDRRSASSWRRAEGRIELDAELDLAGLTAMLPPDLRLLGEAGGRLVVQGSASRSAAQSLPDLELTLRTMGLSFSGPTPEVGRSGDTVIVAAPPWRFRGVDAEQRVVLEGDSGKTTIATRLVDDKDAPLVTLEASATIPYRALVEHPDEALARLETAPLSLRCVVPRRRLRDLPELLRPEAISGVAELSFELDGTLLAPRAKLVGVGTRMRLHEGSRGTPSEVKLVARYEQDKLEGSATLTSGKRDVLTATGELLVRARDLLHTQAPGEVPWVASLRAKLADFPVDLLPPLADAHISGLVQGEVSLTELHRDARAFAHLTLRGMAVDDVAIPAGKVDATYDGAHVEASLQLTQVEGSAAAEASFGMRWGAALWPTLDEREPFEASLRAERFRLAAIAPLVESVASGLDGHLDANARISIPPAGPGAARVVASGSLSVEDGHVQWSRFGDEFSDVRLRVELEPTGVVKLRSLSARSVTGSLSATGEARFDGLRFASAAIALRIPEGQPIPVSVEGQLLAEVSGRIDVTAKSQADGGLLAIDVRVPVLRARLPDAEARSIQALDADPHVRIGTYRTPRELVLIPLSPPESSAGAKGGTKVVVTVHLGDDVELRRASQLRVRLTGTPQIVIADELGVSGQIQILGGSLDVQGRSFSIDHGSVTFVGASPQNPEIVASATWEAPEGAVVYASYAGTATSGTLTLRSDPPLPEGEILALLLFGSADGPGAAPAAEQASDGTARAVGLGGAFATAGINRAMQDLTGLDVETKIDTTRAANPRPEIAVQVTRRISVAVAHVLGTPPPGESPDKSFVRLEWRFLRNWSLESTFGDRGSAVFDVVWKYRY